MGRVLGRLAMASIALGLVFCLQITGAQASAGQSYLVGAARHSIAPDADGTFAGKPVYLGGYGIGGGSPVLAGRPATGVLGRGVNVAAFAVSDGNTLFAIADIEAQGWFAAMKNGPYGLVDMRKDGRAAHRRRTRRPRTS